MSPIEILLDEKGDAISPIEISEGIIAFGDSYSNAIKEIINNSKILGNDGEVFIKCASRILSNFGMTRRGSFQVNCSEKLRSCWNAVGANLIEINNSVRKSGLSRDRYILELSVREREGLIDVLRRMVFDIQKWEGITGRQLNDLDHSKRLTTLPSVYNVMAMLARPKT